MKRLKAGIAGLAIWTALSQPVGAAAPDDTAFLDFPLAVSTSAAKVPAFAWAVREGPRTTILFARAPDFNRVRIFSRGDDDGQPISDVRLSPDGRYIIFQTAAAAGDGNAYNPASLVDAPRPVLWRIETRADATPVRIGEGSGPLFSPDGRRLLYRNGKDLWGIGLGETAASPELVAAGGAMFEQPAWTPDGQGLIFVQDRGGYSFLGTYRPGGKEIEWLVTGADRLSSPTLSPDGKTIAYLRFPGRQHDVTYDQTESEPFAVETVDLATGTVRSLWRTREPAVSAYLDDPDTALRWMGDANLVFYSEHDGWGRLYAIGRDGGAVRALTRDQCEVAESEAVSAGSLLVVHNCGDLDGRQMSIVDVRTGKEQAVTSEDIVSALAVTAGDGAYLALVGGSADEAPLLRVMDLRTKRFVMRERAADYGFKQGFTTPVPKAVRFVGPDGTSVPGQLFLPAGKGPHPALVYVHGGPQRQMFPAFHYMSYYASDYAMNRRFAERGYVVLSVNYRSGTGYGRAFREAPGRGWRGAVEYADVLGAGRWLAARPDVDPERIGIWGGSYGGLLTGQALARNSDLFKAGVAIHGVFDWSFADAKPGHLFPSGFFGVGEKDRGTALKASPLGAIDGWRSPVLLFSGDQDMNVDVRETVDLAQKLEARNVDVRTVILPGEAHDFVRHSSWQRLWREQRKFFDEKLPRPE